MTQESRETAVQALIDLWQRQGTYDDGGVTHPAYCLAKRQCASELAALLLREGPPQECRNCEELHRAWNRENELRRDAEEALAGLKEGQEPPVGNSEGYALCYGRSGSGESMPGPVILDLDHLKLRTASESVGWLNSEGPLNVSPSVPADVREGPPAPHGHAGEAPATEPDSKEDWKLYDSVATAFWALDKSHRAEWRAVMTRLRRRLGLPLVAGLPVSEPLAASQAGTAPREVNRPRIVCLCGSTRFIDQFATATWELELQGNIVLGCTLLPMWFCGVRDHFAEQQGVKVQRDDHHKQKIDLADEVLVLDIGGYIGESTRSEIAYAESLGKPVNYVSQNTALLSRILPLAAHGAVPPEEQK